MTIELIELLIELLRSKNIQFESGLTEIEVRQIENKYGFHFPPDLKMLLQTKLPVTEGFLNWRDGLINNDVSLRILTRIEWPLDGMLFDLKNDQFWSDDWGEKPSTYSEKVEIAKKHYATYPKLIPLYNHRYIPSAPLESGNPVFSVYQTDIVYYGFDLASYFSKEFDIQLPTIFKVKDHPKQIFFWSHQAIYK